jgi:hypothetical protein
MAWQPPTIKVKWGSYFAADPTEQKSLVDMTIAALGKGSSSALITRRQAVEKIAPVFGIENVEAALKDLEKETEERANRELTAATTALAAQGGAGRPGSDSVPTPPAAGGTSGRAASGKDDAS